MSSSPASASLFVRPGAFAALLGLGTWCGCTESQSSGVIQSGRRSLEDATIVCGHVNGRDAVGASVFVTSTGISGPGSGRHDSTIKLSSRDGSFCVRSAPDELVTAHADKDLNEEQTGLDEASALCVSRNGLLACSFGRPRVVVRTVYESAGGRSQSSRTELLVDGDAELQVCDPEAQGCVPLVAEWDPAGRYARFGLCGDRADSAETGFVMSVQTAEQPEVVAMFVVPGVHPLRLPGARISTSRDGRHVLEIAVDGPFHRATAWFGTSGEVMSMLPLERADDTLLLAMDELDLAQTLCEGQADCGLWLQVVQLDHLAREGLVVLDRSVEVFTQIELGLEVP